MMKVSLSESVRQDLCMAYSSSMLRGSEAVALCKSGSFIHSWYGGTWCSLYGTRSKVGVERAVVGCELWMCPYHVSSSSGVPLCSLMRMACSFFASQRNDQDGMNAARWKAREQTLQQQSDLDVAHDILPSRCLHAVHAFD